MRTVVYQPTSSNPSWGSVVRLVALLGTASVLAGVLVGGVGGRLVMRVSAMADSEAAGFVTENGNTVGEITVGGTITLIVFVGALGGMLGSIVVVGAEPWLGWMGPLRGLGFGLAVLAAFGSSDTFDSPDFTILEPAELNVAMFVGLFVAFGFAAAGVYWLLDRQLPPAGNDVQAGYAVVASLGLTALLLVVLFFTAPGFCGCEPAHGIGLAVLVMVVSTVVTLVASVATLVPRWLERTATVTGYSALAVLLAVGLTRTLDQIRDII